MASNPAGRKTKKVIDSRNPTGVVAELLHLALDQMPLPRLLESALDVLFHVPWLGVMSKGSIFLVDSPGAQLKLAAQRNLPDAILEQCQTVAFGHCICGRTAAAGEFTHVPCIDHRHDVQPEGTQPHGHMCVPIKARDKLLGVLNLYVDSHQKIDPDAEHFLTSVTDTLAGIIERCHAEQALAESEARFRSLVETVNDWVWEVDGNGVYTYVSPHIQDLLGYEAHEILGKTPFDLMPAAEAQRIGAIFTKIVEGKESFTRLENTNLHKNGHEVLLETSGAPIFNNEGEFCGYRGVDRDITDKRRAEERFRTLLELAPDAMVIADESGRIVLLNRCAEILFGYDRHELLGREIETLLPETFREKHVGIRNTYLQNPQQRPMGSGKYLNGQRKDGTMFPVDIALGTLPTEKGQLITAVIRDISDFRLAEEELTEMASTSAHGPNPIIEFDVNRTSLKNNAAAGLQFPDLPILGFEHPVLLGIDSEFIKQLNAAFVSRYVEIEKRIYEQKLRYMPLLDRIQIYMWDVTESMQYVGNAEKILDDVPFPGMLRPHELERQLGRAVFQARNNNSTHALLHIKLDGLESLGRQHGLTESTKVLRGIVQIIMTQTNVQVAAAMPEKLNILITDCDQGCAEKMIQELTRLISTLPGPHGSGELSIKARFGVTIIDSQSSSPRLLLRDAENNCH